MFHFCSEHGSIVVLYPKLFLMGNLIGILMLFILSSESCIDLATGNYSSFEISIAAQLSCGRLY